MPELPEVETTVRDLKKKVLSRTFIDVWTDFKKLIKRPKDFKIFKEEVKGKRIINIERRAKNILIRLSGGKTLLIHQKMTGHLLAGKWKFDSGRWKTVLKGPMEDSVNSFIHLIFFLNGGLMLALSDLRKFAKVELWDDKELLQNENFRKLGPEPLNKTFTFLKFKGITTGKRGKIKKVLMDQNIISGIGNIYSDEILWKARVNPLRDVSGLKEKELKNIFSSIKVVLKKEIALKGDSMSDYRLINGEKGGYQKVQKVYRREGKECSVCGGIIKRIKVNGRSAHFCPNCQK